MAELMRFGEHEGIFFRDRSNTDNPDSGLRELSLMYSPHLTDGDILDIAARQGLPIGIIGSRWLGLADGTFGEQYRASLEAMKDLGFTKQERETIPSLDSIGASLGNVGLMHLGRQMETGRQPSLFITPNVRKIGLMGSKKSPGLIPRYNRKEGLGTPVTFTEEWRGLRDKDPKMDKIAIPSVDWIVAIMLDGGVSNGALQHEADMFGERGLFYRGLPAVDQRRLLATDAEDSEFDPSSVRIVASGVSHYLGWCAQLRVMGSPLPDNRHKPMLGLMGGVTL